MRSAHSTRKLLQAGTARPQKEDLYLARLDHRQESVRCHPEKKLVHSLWRPVHPALCLGQSASHPFWPPWNEGSRYATPQKTVVWPRSLRCDATRAFCAQRQNELPSFLCHQEQVGTYDMQNCMVSLHTIDPSCWKNNRRERTREIFYFFENNFFY